jgi:hypothetical protein
MAAAMAQGASAEDGAAAVTAQTSGPPPVPVPSRGGAGFTCPAGAHRRRKPFTAGSPCAPCAHVRATVEVTGRLGELLPTVSAAVLEQTVAAVATSGERAREVLAWLRAHPDPLGRGSSDTPLAAQVLLEQLDRAGVAVAAPRCAACGKPKRRLPVLTDAGRICFGCRQRAGKQPCVRCGNLRIVTARDADGGAVCSQCRAKDPATWRECGLCGQPAPVVAVEDGLVWGRCCYVPPDQRCTLCGRAKAVRRLSGRRSVCRACRDAPVVACAGCGLDAPAPPPSPSSPGSSAPVLCARCRVREALPCTGCGTATASRAKDGTARCPDCYTRPLGVCGRCGRRRVIARLATGADPDLCAGCWRGPVTECAGCGRRRPCRGERTGVMLCETCRPGNRLPCAGCGRTTKITAHWPDGPVCASCYSRTRVLHGRCPGCGQTGRLLRHVRGAPACPSCLGVEDPGVCGNCGTAHDRLWDRGRCGRCTLAARLAVLLPDQVVAKVPGLAGLRAAVADAASPDVVLDWLTRGQGGVLLGGLATGEIACTHEGLDALDQTTSVIHLRHLLVAAGALPDRDPVLAVTTRWAGEHLAGVDDPVQAGLLRRYLRWRLLPPLRKTAGNGPLTDATGYAVRTRLRLATAFLDFLDERERPLHECRAEDLDAWAATRPVYASAGLRPFWAWAIRAGAMPNLVLPRPRGAAPAVPAAGRDERWALARQLLHDDAIPTGDRVAGCLVLIYGQRLGRIVRMTNADILPPATGVVPDGQPGPLRLRLGTTPLQIPQPLAGHVRDLAAAHRGPSTAAVTSPWLFASRLAAGRPMTAKALGDRLARHGVSAAAHRAAALLDLATQMPPSVLADLLGINITTAEHWADLAGRSRSAYLDLPPTR